MKLLWFSHFIPYPPRGGAYQRSYHLLRQAAKSHEIHLVAFDLHNQGRSFLSECHSELGKFCASVEFWGMPIPWKSAHWWLRLMLSPLRSTPYSCLSFWSPALAERWTQTLRQIQPELIHFDSIDLGLFAPATQGFRKVLNHHNCESAMMERRGDNEPNPLKKLFLRTQAHKLARLEGELGPQCDVNLAVSELDAQTLGARAPGAHFHVVENGTDTAYFTPMEGREEPSSIIFAGSMNYYPNIAAVRFLVSKIWPLIRSRRPAARLWLAGQGPPEWMLQLEKTDPNIRVVPNPEDMRIWVGKASVFLCPILDGGGTKLKILDAMAMGKPVVSTSVGCEGLHVSPGKDILVADTPEDFATAVHNLLEDPATRQRLAAAARKLVEEQYGWDAIGHRLEEAYGCAVGHEACPT